MVRPEVFPAVRALAHLVGKSCHMAGGDKNSLLRNGRALDLVIPLLDDIKIPPDILDTPFHHRTERAIIDEAGHRPVALRGGPDEPAASGKLHHVLKDIAHGDHELLVSYRVARLATKRLSSHPPRFLFCNRPCMSGIRKRAGKTRKEPAICARNPTRMYEC